MLACPSARLPEVWLSFTGAGLSRPPLPLLPFSGFPCPLNLLMIPGQTQPQNAWRRAQSVTSGVFRGEVVSGSPEVETGAEKRLLRET